MLLRYKMRQQRGTRWPTESAPRANEKQNGVDEEDILHSVPREPEKRRGAESLHGVTHEDDRTAIEPIRYVSCRQNEDQPRKKQSESRISQVQGAMRDLVHLPSDG